MSMPALICRAAMYSTAPVILLSSATGSRGMPSSRANMICISSSGRGKLPMWVVRKRLRLAMSIPSPGLLLRDCTRTPLPSDQVSDRRATVRERAAGEQIADSRQQTMRPARVRLTLPLLQGCGSRSDCECDCATASCHESLHDGIVAHDAHLVRLHTEPLRHKAQGMQRRLADQNRARARHATDRSANSERVPHLTPVSGREERDIGGDIQLRATPDGVAGRLDVLHAAFRMPSDVDGLHFARTRLAGENG